MAAAVALSAVSIAFVAPPSQVLAPHLRACASVRASVHMLGEESSPGDNEITQPMPTTTPPESDWNNVGTGVALFVLLYSSTLSVAQVIGNDAGASNNAGTAIARLVATGGFIAVQQAAGLPMDAWLTAKPSDGSKTGSPMLASPLAAPTAGLVFFTGAAALGVAVSSAAGVGWDSTLPAARALPEAGAAVDLLVLAPLTEELFFRGWLLKATERAGAPPPLRIVLSAALFALWHIGAGDSPVFFASLGAYLATLYQNSAGSLPLCIGTHATYNLCVVLLRAARM